MTTESLPGREHPIPVADANFVLGSPLRPPFADGSEITYFGMGCFWGAERVFWTIPGVVTTAVGYAGGVTPNPSYEEVCSGRTGHTEAVLVAFDPARIAHNDLLRRFWEAHNPTQGMRQGNDRGSQYRSAVYWTSAEQRDLAETSRDAYQTELSAIGHGLITTEIAKAGPFYYAEDYHQQYLAKNLAGSKLVDEDDLARWYREEAPDHPLPVEGYCSMRGTGVSCPIGGSMRADLG